MSALNADPPPYYSADPKGDNLYNWVATIICPPGTPYEVGIFFLDINFPGDYPFKPQSNVGGGGNLSLDILKESWIPALIIAKMSLGFPESPICICGIEPNTAKSPQNDPSDSPGSSIPGMTEYFLV